MIDVDLPVDRMEDEFDEDLSIESFSDGDEGLDDHQNERIDVLEAGGELDYLDDGALGHQVDDFDDGEEQMGLYNGQRVGDTEENEAGGRDDKEGENDSEDLDDGFDARTDGRSELMDEFEGSYAPSDDEPDAGQGNGPNERTSPVLDSDPGLDTPPIRRPPRVSQAPPPVPPRGALPKGPTHRQYHDKLTGTLTAGLGLNFISIADVSSARPCDKDGNFIEDGTEPAEDPPRRDDWSPFSSRVEFELAELLFLKAEMSQNDMKELFQLWHAANLDAGFDTPPPFRNHKDLLQTIDSIEVGDVPWQCVTIRYSGEIPPDPPKWMTVEYKFYFRDLGRITEYMMANTSFHGQFDYVPYREFAVDGSRRLSDYFSGDFANKQAVSRRPSIEFGLIFIFERTLLGRIRQTMAQCSYR